MYIDFAETPVTDTYKLLTGLVVPRPIAWVTTLNADHSVNLAPFSFFNVFGSNPPIAVIGTGRRPDGSLKDTAENLRQRKHGVIHLVEAEFEKQMSATSASFPSGVSEPEAIGINLEPSHNFEVPSIEGTRVRFYVRLMDQPSYGENLLNILEILALDFEESIYNASTKYVKDNYLPIGRLAGNRYCRSTDRFEMERPS